ncbi:MAG: type I DNA topoisomerase [Candidatus Kerfeldbacteria bacterium]|nr:type I DNA topoisomerase [Candidatus Kerfeldbacteria bacterium]
MKLVIVESPTKAKTITRFLGKGYTVTSSFGHVRDLPKSKIGVDVEHNFEPTYIVPMKSKKHVTELKKLAKKADEIYLATDEDREGEAIAWHLREILGDVDHMKRITFHEITKEAILGALEHPRKLDIRLVDAQQARRILDRLVGYELSPFLWKKVYRGLSAGRVQSVVVRLIVERERSIAAFKPEEYWSIEAKYTVEGVEHIANLHSYKGEALKKLSIENKEEADKMLASLNDAKHTITSIEYKERTRKASAPFTTSTLQQESNNRLGYSAKQTMMLAQQLYEGVEVDGASTGLITYMRTDSLNLSEKFLSEAEAMITKEFGKEYSARTTYKTKSKGAQEAHEAIRPTDVSITPESIKSHLDPKQFKMYDLIWRRAVASQMSAARYKATTIDIAANEGVFRLTGSMIEFPGWIAAMPEKNTDNELPTLKEKQELSCAGVEGKQHFTEPPARYTEAALVKALEERGIGRPSTYAPTIATVQDRGYVRKEQRSLIPEEVGFLVNDLLVEHFPEIVDFDFTANMELSLDHIAEGEKEWQPVLKEFYGPFKEHLIQKEKEIQKSDIVEEKSDEKCPKCGKPMIVKFGRFGKFLACTGYPECKTTQQIDKEGHIVKEEPIDIKCDKCGKPMVRKNGRYGQFLACSGYPECKNIMNIEKKIGIKCPTCNEGDLIEKRSRYGKSFYSCNRYPECKTAFWTKPTGEVCPVCKSLLVFGPKGSIKCSSKECTYTIQPTAL